MEKVSTAAIVGCMKKSHWRKGWGRAHVARPPSAVNRSHRGPESAGGDLYFGRFIYIAARVRASIRRRDATFAEKYSVSAASRRRREAKKGAFYA
jgi:hypothetical protein